MQTEPYTHATPLWAIRLILLVFALFAGGMGWLAFHFDELLPDQHVGFKYFFWFIVAVAVLAAGNPRNHRQQVQFLADRKGLTFPARDVADLQVPWDRVGEIRLGLVNNQWDGFAIEMRLSDKEIKTYFEAVRLTKKFLLQPVRDREGYFSVGFADAFINRKQAVAILNQLKAQAGRPRGHWVDD